MVLLSSTISEIRKFFLIEMSKYVDIKMPGCQ